MERVLLAGERCSSGDAERASQRGHPTTSYASQCSRERPRRRSSSRTSSRYTPASRSRCSGRSGGRSRPRSTKPASLRFAPSGRTALTRRPARLRNQKTEPAAGPRGMPDRLVCKSRPPRSGRTPRKRKMLASVRGGLSTRSSKRWTWIRSVPNVSKYGLS